MSRTYRGFSFVELMVVVAIIAILASIALPAYRDYVLRTRRVAAQSDMLEIAQLAERFYTANTSYAGFALPAGWDTFPRNSGDPLYTVALVTTARTFTITATPAGPQSNEPCGTVSINHQNIRTSSTGDPTGCW